MDAHPGSPLQGLARRILPVGSKATALAEFAARHEIGLHQRLEPAPALRERIARYERGQARLRCD